MLPNGLPPVGGGIFTFANGRTFTTDHRFWAQHVDYEDKVLSPFSPMRPDPADKTWRQQMLQESPCLRALQGWQGEENYALIDQPPLPFPKPSTAIAGQRHHAHDTLRRPFGLGAEPLHPTGARPNAASLLPVSPGRWARSNLRAGGLDSRGGREPSGLNMVPSPRTVDGRVAMRRVGQHRAFEWGKTLRREYEPPGDLGGCGTWAVRTDPDHITGSTTFTSTAPIWGNESWMRRTVTRGSPRSTRRLHDGY